LRSRLCAKCGREFTPATINTTICGECAKKSATETAKRLVPHVCQLCGKQFLGRYAAKYCKDCLPEMRRKWDAEQRKSGSKRHIGDMDYCVICGKEYIIRGAKQKYCADCVARAKRDRRIQKGPPSKRIRYNIKSLYICGICGKQFESAHIAKYCSAECKRAAHLIAAKQYHERVKAKQQCREEEAKKNGT